MDGNEWTYVKQCLDDNWVSSAGPYVDTFENEMADQIGVTHAVSTVNGTAALHVALLACGVEPDDEVLVSDLTFIAPVNAIRYVGAHPVLVDADIETWQINPTLIGEFLENQCERKDSAVFNTWSGRRVSAILPVHIIGQAVDMAPIIDLARTYGLTVIEDASEGLGARYRGRPVGQLGDIACFSFNGNKLITTGGGGAITTENADWHRRAKHLVTQAKLDPVEYIHDEIGYNYRLTNMLAAMGCAQLERLSDHIAAKRRIAATYDLVFSDIDGITPMPRPDWSEGTCWMYTVAIDPEAFGHDRYAVAEVLQQSKVQTRPLWQPMHLSPAHAGCDCLGGDVSEALWRKTLSLPCSVGLTESDQQRVIDLIRNM